MKLLLGGERWCGGGGRREADFLQDVLEVVAKVHGFDAFQVAVEIVDGAV